MKTQITRMLFILLLISKISFGDIVVVDHHEIIKCIKITNLDEYPGIVLLGYRPILAHRGLIKVNSNECIEEGITYNDFFLYAANKTYINTMDISKIYKVIGNSNLIPSNIQIDPFGRLVHDSDQTSHIYEYYKILGFNSNSLVIHKWMETISYGGKKPDLTTYFEYEGDLSKLSKQIPVGIDAPNLISKIELFPNPVKKNLNLKISNDYKGKIQVQIVSSDGKLMRTLFLHKKTETFNYEIPVGNMPKGDYLAKFEFGKKMETKRFIVE
jgi:hypothetical protein